MHTLDMNLLEVKPTFLLDWRGNKNAYMMSASTPSFRKLVVKPSHRHWNKNMHRSSLQVVRAHSFKDEGRSSNMVDANLRILRERIEEVRNKERLERYCNRSEEGWNYTPLPNSEYNKRETILSQCFDIIGLMAGTVGLTILSATFFLFFVSLLLQALRFKE